MPATIGSLRAVLGIDTAQFESGLKKAQSSLGNFGGIAKTAGLAAAAGMAAATTALGYAVKGAIDAADAMNDAAQKFGLPVAELSRLKYAAEMSGSSLEGLGTGVQKLSKNMADVASGGGKAASAAFERLGVSVRNADGTLRGSSDVLSDVADKFDDMQDGAGKTATAMALFGKSGADLIPMLNEGRDGLQALKDEADALGIVIDQKTATAADAFNDNLQRLQMTGQGVTTQIAARLLPTLQTLSGQLVGAAKNASIMDGVAKVLSVTLKAIATGVVITGGAFKWMGDNIGGAAKAMMLAAKGDFSGAWAALTKGSADSIATIKGSVSAIRDIWTDAGASAVGAAKAANSQGGEQWAAAAGKAAKGAKATKEARDTLADDLERINERLMSSRERFDKAEAESIAKLQEGFAKGKLSADKLTESLERLRMARVGEYDLVKDPFKKYDKLNDNVPGISALEDMVEDKAQLAEDIREMWTNAIDDGIRAALDGDLRAFLSSFAKDAMSAGLTKAFQQGGKGLSGTDKASAGAALVDMLGQKIGGKSGGALSGAAQGFQLGMMTGNPLIAAGASAIGGLMGFLNGGKAEKAAKAAEAVKKAEEELTRAREAAQAAAARLKAIEDERRGLEIRLLELSGDKIGALAARRKDELAALDASNRALAEQANAWEDYNEKVAAAEDKVASAREALSAAYAHAYETENAALEKVATGIEATISGIEDAGAALQGVREKFAGFLQSLGAYRTSLNATAAAIRSPSDLLRVMTSAFKAANDDVARGADAGFEALQGVSEQYLDAGKGVARTQLDVLRQMAEVRNAVQAAEAIAGAQVEGIDHQLEVNRLQLGAAHAQLQAIQDQGVTLKSQYDAILNVNGSVLTVADAIAQLGAALGAQVALKANPPSTSAAPAAAGPDWGARGIAAGITSQRGALALSDWMRAEQLFLAEYTNFAAVGSLLDGDKFWQLPPGSMAGVAARYGLPAFATGGGFHVGGSGGIDSQVRAMRLTPGERVDVSTPGQMNDNAQQLRGLRDDIGMLTRRVEAVAIHTASTAADSRLNRKDGLPVRAQDPTLPIDVRVA